MAMAVMAGLSGCNAQFDPDCHSLLNISAPHPRAFSSLTE